MGIFDLLGISSNENRDSAGPQLACPSDEVIVESQERTTSSPLPPHVTSNTPILEKIIETSITLGYQSDVWGVKRIAEDGIQNHLPSDSHGSRFDIEFLVDGKVIPYSEKSEVDPSRVKAIRFIDDGTGFSYDLLGVFHSTKKDEVDSVGQFGEGIKMLSAACLREGIDLEIRSRDWFARPVVNDLLIDGQNVRQMCYEVYNHQPNMQGSMTTFKDPGNEFVDYVLNLDDTVLELCGDSDVKVFKTSKGSVLKHKGRIYVKGIHITDDFKENLLFGYDLVSDTNRDRNMVNPNLLNNQIGGVIRQLDNKDLIKTILDASTITSNYMEFDALYWDRSVGGGGHGGLRVTNPEIWRETFYELFGDKAVLTAVDGWGGSLSSKKASDKLAALAGYKVIRIKSDSICQTLTGCGVETSKSISVDDNARLLQGENYNPDDVQIRVAETSLTSQYRSKKWDAKRIVLDTLANHMPNDSGGSHVDTEYFVISDKRTEGQWIKIKDKTLFDEVQALRFTDDGTGYSSKFLEFLYTTKESSEAVGQFGEGLKMLCNAFLGFSKSHEGMDLKLRSRDWVGMPFSSDLTLDDHETKRLNFRIAEGIEEMVGSTTTVYKPSIEMLKVVSSIQKFVLAFNSDYRSRSQTEDGAVFKGEKYQ